jgi:hypothetical protein
LKLEICAEKDFHSLLARAARKTLPTGSAHPKCRMRVALMNVNC